MAESLVIGTEELIKSLDGLAQKIQNRILRQAITQGCNVLKRTAKELAPIDTGTLRKSLVSKVKTSKNNTTGKIGGSPDKVTVDGKQHVAWRYLHLVELGTTHSKAQPFLAPALAQEKDKVYNLIAQKIQEGIAKL
jgi:HK97 gp10 family phage protein